MKWFKKLWHGNTVSPNKETTTSECDPTREKPDNGSGSKSQEHQKQGGAYSKTPSAGQVCIKCQSKSGTCSLCLGLDRRTKVINSSLKFREQLPLSSSSSEDEVDEEKLKKKKSQPIDIVLKKRAKQLESLISSSVSSGSLSVTAGDEKDREIVDPDEFFEDPSDVDQLKEQQLFADWIIVDKTGETLSLTPSVTSFTDTDFGNLIGSIDQGAPQSFTVFYCCLDRVNHNRDCALKASTSDKRSEKKKSDQKKQRKTYKKEALASSLMGPMRAPQVEDSSSDLSQLTPIERNVIDYFGLNDKGRIIIHFEHIVEETGFATKKSNKQLYRNVKRGLEMYEGIKIRLPMGELIKNLLLYIGRKFKCHPRNKSTSGGPGDSVEAYALSLAGDRTSTFARNIENFISCTKDSRESTPQVVMRNMRQFMSGMKNYLVKHGEGDFAREVQMARSKLKPDEFLNLDTILESVMHRLIVLPLREHLYALFVDYYTRSGDIQLLVENVKYAAGRSATEFGIRASVIPPSTSSLRQISLLLLKLQEVELPLEKLDILLASITTIFEATSGSPRGQPLSADDFLPLLVLVVAKCGFIGAEIEAEFMWGLMQPSLLSGEAGYYLTALCSAVHVLKSFMTSDTDGTGSLDWRSSSMPACSSVLRVIIPDELNGSLQTRTLPVRPHTTTKEVCRIIAHKARITNPQDYGLFKLLDGEETILLDSECPQDARIAARGKHCILAYKRIDAKIAWPTSTASYQ